jgi:hypothetical protein
MEELFWLGMGYDSDDGERDESFAPSQESDAEDAEDGDAEEHQGTQRKKLKKREC